MTEPDVIVCRNLEDLADDAARRFAAAAAAAIATRGRFTGALSGGSTPKSLYKRFAAPEWRSRIPWPRVFLFWGDE